MKESQMNYLKKSLWVVAFLIAVRCIIDLPVTLYGWIGSASEAISVCVIVMAIYEKILWRWNPFEKTPKIFGEYSAVLEYESQEGFKKKKIKIFIGQSLLSTSIKIITNEITSNSITGNFVCENGEYVLYYTYITNPKSRYSTDNPVQYGTCRMTIQSDGLLAGNYWTTRKTKGDITLKKKLDTRVIK
jgi:hypothetical protein